ncbi:MAG: hypothetical protein HEQ27_18445 [Dolichospermum sp. JUN01]|jgi:hypothetical protein|uniref:hypothetical protein n=1 Tax=Dolichospermum TaxID=748770 RepID=UPI0011E68291|nr:MULTISPECIES: hypothetical protein [Dolichospermum]MBO1047093.1 hypothetical protein [Dolichospermum sp. DEX182a]MBO1058377.1 hypothetical protein [Dolichospermum sp. JUN01]MBS9386462.1 hypothetical protein [Dolichospermum sp. BR01]QEI43013.1 hypothetical protein BMF77_03629 [Dolichospermum sp. UHCC 0315A]
MNARELSCVARIVFERSENKEGYSDEMNKILILCYYKRVGVVQLNAPNAAYKTKNKSQNQRTVGRTVLKLS